MKKNREVLSSVFKKEKPIIGMVHLRPLPGSPRYDPEKLGMKEILRIAVEEARIMEGCGVDGLQIENIWDFPYLKGERIGHETSAALAVATQSVREAVNIPVGVNCHLNGGKAALAAAVAGGAKWIRIFEWVNAYVSHAGLTEGIGAELSRYRKLIGAEEIKFMCDVNVKHGSHFIISDRSVEEQAHDAESEGAEILIVTGFETGQAPNAEKVKSFSEAVSIPVMIGSGLTKENAGELLKFADGAIVGSYFKRDNNWKNPVDPNNVRSFMKTVESLREAGYDD
ncbi:MULTISPECIES: BtpA/SgcQ family protein [Mesotoga]|uniref:BtpA/SgcQ family protein n=1 Tax=Mesotoga TaxID=1184396 RepID=UPI0002C925EA|nr:MULTISPECIES: BtpA/SgcQ family protein [Mesotoga]MCP5457324.1 BtpA/SgcQ family protein [Thermotogota bacterium]CCU84353.1 Photosystem I assembly BtpA [Mesotoga infera]MCB1223814.1 BtpA/SgcQ family protein [Mesotoga sp.]MDK2943777.1 uncharacterized protein [Mesotoga sp.]HNQ70773.1 BtpA/SgcQ family protein [Mesotoga prima]